MALTAKQSAFVTEYLRDFNASGAARRAGYSKNSAGAIGHENLKKPEIQKALSKIQKERRQEAIMEFDEACLILTEKARASFADYMTNGGRLDIEQLREVHPRAVHSIDQEVRVGDEDEDDVTITKVRLSDGIRAVEALAKLKGWNAPDKHEVKHEVIGIKDPEGWGEGEYEDPPELDEPDGDG